MLYCHKHLVEDSGRNQEFAACQVRRSSMFLPRFQLQQAASSLLRYAAQLQRQVSSSAAVASSSKSSEGSKSYALVYDRPGDPETALCLKRLPVEPCDVDQIEVKFLLVSRTAWGIAYSLTTDFLRALHAFVGCPQNNLFPLSACFL